MRMSTFIGVTLVVVAVVLAVVGIAGMPNRHCSGSFDFVRRECPELLRGFALLLGGFVMGGLGSYLIARGRRQG